MEDTEDRNFVTALARGLDVLRCFRPNEVELSNTEIAARTGLPKPTVSRLTYTLCRLDYLVLVKASGAYRLGPGVLALGYGVLSGLDIAERAAEAMIRLCEGPNTHVTCSLGERHKLDAVCMAVRSSKEAVSLTVRVGARVPMFTSSLGRALICGMNDMELEYLREVVRAEAPETLDEANAQIESARAEFAEYGVTRDFGAWRPEINGIAVPIRSLNGDRIYGLNVGGPGFLLSPDELMEQYAPRMMAAAQELSRQA